ncbi:MAG: CRISPR-associated endonuclease Cas2 [Rhodoferax sp.]
MPGMTRRDLHLACYDVADPKRLVAALKLARVYATGGQKSVHEIFLTPAERDTLIADMRSVLDLREDRFLLLRLDPRSRVHTLGTAIAPADPDYFYVG